MASCEIHYLTKNNFKPILAENPHIDKLHFLEKPLYKTIKQIKAQQFDLIIDLHKNLRTRLIALFSGVKTITYNKLNLEKWLMVNFKINLLPKKHLVDRYFDSLQHINIKNDNEGLDFFIHPQNAVDLPNREYIAIAVGAKHFTKKIPLEKFIEIIRDLKSEIVLLGDNNDLKTAAILKDRFKKKVHNYCGRLNIQQSAFMVKNSSAVLTADTGLMHIAAAFNKPIFSLWGNTITSFGMYPYLFNKRKVIPKSMLNIFDVEHLSCRPCSKIGYNTCPKGHFKCMQNIKTKAIADGLNASIQTR